MERFIITELSSGINVNPRPRKSGDNVVWQSGSDNEREIFLYDGNEIIQLTNNNIADTLPRIFGDNIVWHGKLGGDDEIFLYDGSETTQITDNDVNDLFPRIYQDRIVWQRGSGDESEILLYDGNETIQLTDNNAEDTFASNSINSVLNNNIVGDNVLWRSEIDNNTEQLFYNGSETIQLTNNGEINSSLISSLIDNSDFNFFYYSRGTGNEREIFVYDGNETIQLTDDNIEDSDFISISSGGRAVWQRLNISESGEKTISLFLATPNVVYPTSAATVYRFFNNDTGVHFYTANEIERDTVQQLDNYNFEGASYQSIDPLTGNPEPDPVYRFFNQDTGVHLYTVSETEREAVAQLDNFSFEGEAFAAYATEVEGTIPIYRFLNTTTGAHFYTPSATERDNVENNLPSFQSEGIAYYALPLDDIE